MYELYRELEVKTTREKAWEFIRSPGNLNKITPDDLSFEIVSDLPDEMFEGMLVEYRVNIPVINKQEWVSGCSTLCRAIHLWMSRRLVPSFGIIIMVLKRLRGVKLIDQVSYKPRSVFWVRLRMRCSSENARKDF